MLRALCGLIVALAAVACGGGSETPTSAPTVGGDVLTVDLSDFRFAPATITISAGSPIELRLRNSGSVVHNWTVLSSEITRETDFDDSLVLATGEVVAGAQDLFTFEPPPPGSYQVICTVATHFTQGMAGELIVTSG